MFKRIQNTLNALKSAIQPRSGKLEIDCYNQEAFDPQLLNELIEGLMESLMVAGYWKKAHLIFDEGNSDWQAVILEATLRDEIVFAYRLGEKLSPTQNNVYWKLTDDPGMRIYQLTKK